MGKLITCQLGDLIEFKNGKAIKPNNGIFPIYGGNGILGYSSEFSAERSLIVGRVGAYCGSVFFEKKKFWVSDNAILGVPKNSINAEYAYYLLKQLDLNSKHVGSSQPLLTQGILNSLKVSIYKDLLIQQKIAQVLSSLDRKIALNQQINAELEKMAKTLYDYWFVQFDFPDENGNPYKSSGGEMVYNPELKRDVPKGWECDFVENYLDKVPNTDKIPSKEIQVKGQIPVIDQSQDYICGFTDNENALLEPIDAHIIFGDHTRVVKLVNFPYARGADGTQIIISNNKKLPNFLFYQMIAKIDLSNYGYARHYKFLKESKVLIPTEYIAQKYHQTVKPYFDLWKTNLKETQKLTQLRDFLLPMLMNGQVEVV
ncbi:restriction endonuclease subunit S [Actinobacillus equuli]|uniref:restriction endonuclease subunit S n=1 Tax=Actinobacillus equuli TaxID=718 RepID=UPI002441F923|nr:restriction endonuclease subunit S [Actinobacillus equuli]WGE65296.1 restriction endonuclease subunit S [Actinobacillus equuli subsp. equuli]WGE79278.1 restriction endonuclease subunit S [Actinobacillus equuli subsp. equuli]